MTQTTQNQTDAQIPPATHDEGVMTIAAMLLTVLVEILALCIYTLELPIQTLPIRLGGLILALGIFCYPFLR